MRQEHDYCVHGHSRVVWGRWLGQIAAWVAALAVLGAGAALNVMGYLGLQDRIPQFIFWPLTAGFFYALIRSLFGSFVWRWNPVVYLTGAPSLEGQWNVEGQTLDKEMSPIHSWRAVITITQTWEKIRIHLKSENGSISSSISAALIPEKGIGYRLLYSYENEGSHREAGMSPHIGFADVLFSNNLKTAEGDYFNNKGRYTFGRIKLTKKKGN